MCWRPNRAIWHAAEIQIQDTDGNARLKMTKQNIGSGIAEG